MVVTAVRKRTPVFLTAALAAAVAGLAGFSVPAYAHGTSRPALSVGGEVTTPAAYTAAQLAALPQSTVTVKEGGRQVLSSWYLATGRRPGSWPGCRS
jgi:hypothetical protein